MSFKLMVYGTDYEPAITIHMRIDEMWLFKGYLARLEERIDIDIQKPDDPNTYVFDDESEQVNQYIYGIDGQTWHLETIFKEFFPNLERCSTLISFYSFMENSLNDICNVFQKSENLKLNYADINGKGIDKARSYLNKVIGIEFSSFEKTWSEIKDVQRLRNNIVHERGTINQNIKKALLSFIKKSPHLDIHNDEVIVKDSFLPYFLDLMIRFYEGLLKVVVAFHKKK